MQFITRIITICCDAVRDRLAEGRKDFDFFFPLQNMEKKTGEQRELSWERLSMVYSRETEGEKNKKAMEKQETRAYS